MNKPIRYESIQEPLDEEERLLMDSDNWDWDNPIEVVVSDNLVITLEITISPEEHSLLARAASVDSQPTYAFIKQAALDAARAKSPELAATGVSRRNRESRS